MIVNRKGFTLVELLATIVILSLVVGLSAYGIVSAINSSKSEANIISESSLFESARVYSGEADSESWKSTDNYDAFCVTIGELMNKGLIDKDADIDKNAFILVKRNKVTLAIEKEEMASDGENYNICTGQSFNESESIIAPTVGSSTRYTDKLVINFNPGSATYSEGDIDVTSTVSYSCLYGNSSSSVNRVGKIEGNKCVINNLKNNQNYYVMIYMDTNHGSTVLAEGEKEFSTSNFKNTNMTSTSTGVKITFYDTDNSGNSINGPSHYFKSSISGTTDVSVKSCTLRNDVFTCDGSSTTSIGSGTWYKTDNTTVNITFSVTNGSALLATRIYDGNNNFKENENNFNFKTINIKFYKSYADNIGGSTSEYIEKSCLAVASGISSGSCSITSPTITRSGWTSVGWGTSASATSSSWGANTSKSVSANATYYAITKKVITILFNSNGATSIGSSSQSCTMYNNNTNCSITSPTITRSGFTITGWGDSASATSSSWNVSTSKDVNANATYYAITSKLVTISFNSNGATSIGSTSQSCTIQNSSTSCNVTSPTITRSGFTITGWGTSSDATSSSWSASTSKNVTANATYYAITSKKVTISFNSNGATSIGSTSQSCTIQNSNTSCNVTSPTITRSGFTIVGWGTSSGATSSSWNVSTSKSVSANATYYAVTSKKITLSFNGNGGTAGSSSKNCTIYNNSSSCSITMPSASRSGYSFVGWGTSSSSSSSSYSSGATYSFSSDKTLYAVWAVSCSGNSGSKEFSTSNGSKANGFKGRLYWRSTCNSDGTIDFDITDLQFYSTYTYGYTFYLDGYIRVNGYEAKWCNAKASGPFVTVPFTSTGTWYSIQNHPDFSTVTLPSGTKSVTIKFEKYNYSYFAGLYGDRTFWVNQSFTVNL